MKYFLIGAISVMFLRMHSMNVQEKIALSEWQTGKFKTRLIEIPHSKFLNNEYVPDANINAVVFGHNDQSQKNYTVCLRGECVAPEWRDMLYVDNYFNLDIQNGVWTTVSKEVFNDLKHIDLSFELRDFGENFMLKQPWINKNSYKLISAFSSDYTKFACVYNNVTLCLIELYDMRLICKMNKACNAMFSFEQFK